jgi:hypothetical protein
MAERATMQIKNKNELSPLLYDQFCGLLLPDCCKNFVEFVKYTYPYFENYSTPFTRKEPSALISLFILKYYTKDEDMFTAPRLFDSTYPVFATEHGHWIIDFEKFEVYKKDD